MTGQGRWLFTENPATTVHRELYRGVCAAQAWGVVGDVAEFGTMTGVSAFKMALALGSPAGLEADGGRPRHLHLFDSFEGLPQPVGNDLASPEVIRGSWGRGTHVGLTAEQLWRLCASQLPRSRLRIFKGWFADTIPTIPPGTRYAMIHVDCDLYSSAVDVLDGLFSRGLLTEGAQIFFDDYNCGRASPALGERRAWRECVDKYRVVYDDLGDYGLVSHRFTVHHYAGMFTSRAEARLRTAMMRAPGRRGARG